MFCWRVSERASLAASASSSWSWSWSWSSSSSSSAATSCSSSWPLSELCAAAVASGSFVKCLGFVWVYWVNSWKNARICLWSLCFCFLLSLRLRLLLLHSGLRRDQNDAQRQIRDCEPDGAVDGVGVGLGGRGRGRDCGCGWCRCQRCIKIRSQGVCMGLSWCRVDRWLWLFRRTP